MLNAKEQLINDLVMKLADNVGISIGELKNIITMELYDYSVEKIETTEISVGDGSVTASLFNYFKIGKLSSGMQQDSIRRYYEVVEQLCNFTHKELNMITSEDINIFLYMYKDIYKIQNSTMQSKRLYLSSVFSYLYKHKKISCNPMELIEPIKCKIKVKKPLSDEEIEKIRMACEQQKGKVSHRNIAMINFMLDTGVRVGELCKINISDVDFIKKRVLILGKGNKERYVYFSDRTKVRLEVYFKDRQDISINGFDMIYSIDCPLFANVNCKHGRLSKSSVEIILKTVGKLSNVNRLHPHLLRATFATNLARKGVDINTIAKALGHSNLNTIHRYVLLNDEQVNNAIKSVGYAA